VDFQTFTSEFSNCGSRPVFAMVCATAKPATKANAANTEINPDFVIIFLVNFIVTVGISVEAVRIANLACDYRGAWDNARIRETKIVKRAIAHATTFLLRPQPVDNRVALANTSPYRKLYRQEGSTCAGECGR